MSEMTFEELGEKVCKEVAAAKAGEINHAEIAKALESLANGLQVGRYGYFDPLNSTKGTNALKQAAADERKIASGEYAPMPPPQTDNHSGLKVKYRVYHAEDNTPVEGDCFMLRPDKDPAAVMALQAYALFTGNVQLSRDITEWLRRIERKEEKI